MTHNMEEQLRKKNTTNFSQLVEAIDAIRRRQRRVPSQAGAFRASSVRFEAVCTFGDLRWEAEGQSQRALALLHPQREQGGLLGQSAYLDQRGKEASADCI